MPTTPIDIAAKAKADAAALKALPADSPLAAVKEADVIAGINALAKAAGQYIPDAYKPLIAIVVGAVLGAVSAWYAKPAPVPVDPPAIVVHVDPPKPLPTPPAPAPVVVPSPAPAPPVVKPPADSSIPTEQQAKDAKAHVLSLYPDAVAKHSGYTAWRVCNGPDGFAFSTYNPTEDFAWIFADALIRNFPPPGKAKLDPPPSPIKPAPPTPVVVPDAAPVAAPLKIVLYSTSGIDAKAIAADPAIKKLPVTVTVDPKLYPAGSFYPFAGKQIPLPCAALFGADGKVLDVAPIATVADLVSLVAGQKK